MKWNGFWWRYFLIDRGKYGQFFLRTSQKSAINIFRYLFYSSKILTDFRIFSFHRTFKFIESEKIQLNEALLFPVEFFSRRFLRLIALSLTRMHRHENMWWKDGEEEHQVLATQRKHSRNLHQFTRNELPNCTNVIKKYNAAILCQALVYRGKQNSINKSCAMSNL